MTCSTTYQILSDHRRVPLRIYFKANPWDNEIYHLDDIHQLDEIQHPDEIHLIFMKLKTLMIVLASIKLFIVVKLNMDKDLIVVAYFVIFMTFMKSII